MLRPKTSATVGTPRRIGSVGRPEAHSGVSTVDHVPMLHGQEPGTPPGAPTSLVLNPGDTVIGLSWQGHLEALSYRVKRSLTAGGPYEVVGTPSAMAYTDTGLTNGVTYYYVVSALDLDGESPNSLEGSGNPQEAGDFVSWEEPWALLGYTGNSWEGPSVPAGKFLKWDGTLGDLS
jgi:hypothetical protein